MGLESRIPYNIPNLCLEFHLDGPAQFPELEFRLILNVFGWRSRFSAAIQFGQEVGFSPRGDYGSPIQRQHRAKRLFHHCLQVSEE